MVQVNLPPGCRSLAFEDGTRYVAPRSGGRIDVTHDHAAAIDKISGNGDAGLVTAQFRAFGGTKAGAGAVLADHLELVDEDLSAMREATEPSK